MLNNSDERQDSAITGESAGRIFPCICAVGLSFVVISNEAVCLARVHCLANLHRGPLVTIRRSGNAPRVG